MRAAQAATLFPILVTGVLLPVQIRDYGVDGVVMFSNRSCRPQSIGQQELIQLKPGDAFVR